MFVKRDTPVVSAYDAAPLRCGCLVLDCIPIQREPEGDYCLPIEDAEEFDLARGQAIVKRHVHGTLLFTRWYCWPAELYCVHGRVTLESVNEYEER